MESGVGPTRWRAAVSVTSPPTGMAPTPSIFFPPTQLSPSSTNKNISKPRPQSTPQEKVKSLATTLAKLHLASGAAAPIPTQTPSPPIASPPPPPPIASPPPIIPNELGPRILFLTLEFAEPWLFSGNGVYSRTFVFNLVRFAGCRVLVVCGRPAGSTAVARRRGHPHSHSKSSASDIASTSSTASSTASSQTIPLPPLFAAAFNLAQRAGYESVRSSDFLDSTPHSIQTNPSASLPTNPARDEDEALDEGRYSYEGGRIEIRTVALPTWYRLDRDSSWREFGEGVKFWARDVAKFRADVVLGVDWTSRPALETLRRHEPSLKRIPFVYLCFRVFSNPSSPTPTTSPPAAPSATLFATRGSPPPANVEDKKFYQLREAETMQVAARTIALSRSDAKSLESLRSLSFPSSLLAHVHHAPVAVIAPPLRDEVRSAAVKVQTRFAQHRKPREKWSSMTAVHSEPALIGTSSSLRSTGGVGIVGGGDASQSSPFLPQTLTASNSATNGQGTHQSSALPTNRLPLLAVHDPRSFSDRIYVTCCCRISPEKNVLRFAEIVERVAPFLKSRGFIPYLVGPPTDALYARRVYQRLKRAFPGDASVVVSDFVAPEKLQAIFSRTVLNVHPAEREPFGMTIIEAASFGAPSLVHWSGSVGACDVLPINEMFSLGTDMSSVKIAAATLKTALREDGAPFLELVGRRARERCLERLSAKEHASSIMRVLHEVMRNNSRLFPSASNQGLIHGQPSSPRSNNPFGNRSISPRPSSPRSNRRSSSMASGDSNMGDGNGVEDAYPWWAMLEWVVNTSPILSQKGEDALAAVDVGAVKLVLQQLVSLPAFGLSVALRDADAASVGNNVQLTDEIFAWGEYLLKQEGSSLGAARFRLVPSKMQEQTFWRVLFGVVRDGVERLTNKDSGANTSDGVIDEEDEESTPDQKYGNGVATPPRNDARSIVERLERLVQRDEGGRGIAAIVTEVGGNGQLLFAAQRLWDAKRVILLTGFPCVQRTDGGTPQETDGPPGAVGIARALSALGKRVVLLVEKPVSSVVRACVESTFPKAQVLALRAASTTKLISYGTNGEVQVEEFPVVWKPAHYDRLEQIVMELVAEGGVALAIERAGPGQDGRCRTMRGRVMADLIAPLHQVFERAAFYKVPTIGIGDGGNELGMGKALQAVRERIPMGEVVGCVVSSDVLIACSVSNWGGYALAAALAVIALEHGHFSTNKEAIMACLGTDEDAAKVVMAAVNAGACDGVTFRNEATVDNLPLSKSLEVLGALRKVVEEFER